MNRRASMLWFHWITALLVIASFAIAWIRKDIEALEFRAFWLDVHRTIGFVILALTVARLAWRLMVGPLSQRAELPPALWLASRTTHSLIYACLIAMPLLGWAQSSARARHFNLFGVPMPALVRRNPDLADSLGWWHEQIGWVLFTLIFLHTAAALYHHYFRRDDVVRAMLPGYRPLPEEGKKIPYDLAA
jgi:cytochrome b561